MTYPGGKNGSGVYQQIINRIPPHKVYVEPFLGSGAILRMKRPAAINIAIDIDPEITEKGPGIHTPNLTMRTGDALIFLSRTLFSGDTFIYCDPPYLMDSRSCRKKIYAFEFSDIDHGNLLNIIKSLPCMVMISGYPNAIYDAALSGWWTATYQTTTRRGKLVTEKLWMNYAPPIRLHDYRYLGNNFRERERIKRKKDRWTSRLLSMPDLERSALAAAIAGIDEPCSYRQIERAAPVPIAKKIDTSGEAPTSRNANFDDKRSAITVPPR